jgi:LacI family transcriptional regulator
MYNIYDVAKKAGVSRSTVSRVINNQESVKDDKRERVLEAIKELNYTPNATARALAMNKTNTIGVIARELTESFNAKFIDGIHQYADQMHYGVIFCIRSNTNVSNVNYIDFLNKKVDGLIFIGQDTVSEDELISLAKSQIPVVAMEIEYPVEHITFINVNNRDSVYKAIEHLGKLGHKRIVNITTEDKTQERTARNKGYEDGLNDLGLAYKCTYELPYNFFEARHIARSILPRLIDDKVTAAFCYNNEIGAALCEALITNGYDIPKDFSIVGFDDMHYTNLSEVPYPRLTSFLQPQRDMAFYAISTLIQIINRKKGDAITSKSKEFKCKLMIHESTTIVSNEG